MIEAGGQRRRRQQLHARRGQLDGQGEPVQPGADAGHRRRVLGRQREARSDGLRALDEEGDGGNAGELARRRQPRQVGEEQRRHLERALSGEVQGRAARDQHLQ
jgi:hypothetical protein